MQRILLLIIAFYIVLDASANPNMVKEFHRWAATPPMGWNSWDCYGPTVVEQEVKDNADYMAKHLKDYGWEYVVVDIRWFVENDKAGGYNQTDPIYVYDEWGRYTPALNRFPSAADGVGFKALADYVHDKGLKFGIHIMRGIPKEAVNKKLPIKGAEGITADMIANNDSTCTWLRDNMKVDWKKPGAQQYYNSIFDLYAEWGVDFIKVDDLSRPYHTAELEMIRKAIDQTGRPMVLSISPGETPVEKAGHAAGHANMWRTVDDFWDNWNQLSYQFDVCAKWAPYIAPGTWPDADMLPLGKISIRGERGAERYTQFTEDEQKTMMNLWTIFKSPLMFGGDLPQNDEATNDLLTNRDVLYMHSYSAGNRQVRNLNNHITWSAVDPMNGDIFVALFNTGGNEFVATDDVLWRSGTISYLTTGYATEFDVEIPAGTKQLSLIATDGGDGYDSDHADWINPVLVMADGSETDLTDFTILRNTCGWGETHVNSNLEGGKLRIDGKEYSKGFATHANSILIFDLPENVIGIKGIAGIDNTGTDQGSKSSIEFMICDYDPTIRHEYTDEWTGGNVLLEIDPTKQLATSGYVSRKSANPVSELSADITGAEKLYLVVTNGGDNLSYDHADWANPVLVKTNGEEVSLTTINWDADPVNGWYEPKLNKNNDGNTMSLNGVKYDKGFGVNAPSMLVFTLPENHDYVSIKVITGLDDDIQSAPEEFASVEFRIFTQNPAPNNDANVVLDMQALGFKAGQKGKITDMWTGHEIGTYSDNEYAPLIRAHASELFRLSPQGRTDDASLTISENRIEAPDENTSIKIVLSGSDDSRGFIMLMCDDLPVAIYETNGDSDFDFCMEKDGKAHEFKAYFSGTTSIAPSESDALIFEGAGVSLLSEEEGIKISSGQGFIEIKSEKDILIPLYDIHGRMIKGIKVAAGSPTRIELAPGLYILNKKKVIVGGTL